MFDKAQVHVWYVPETYPICLRVMFDMSLTHVWYFLDPSLKCLRLMFDMFVSCLIWLRLMYDIRQIYVWYVSDSCLICLRLMFDMSQCHVHCSICLSLMFVMSHSHVCLRLIKKTILRCIEQWVKEVSNSSSETYWTARLRHIKQHVWDLSTASLRCTKHRSEMYQLPVWDEPNTGWRHIE